MNVVSAITSLAKDWPERRGPVLSSAAGIAAALVVVAFVDGPRPLQSLAVVTDGLGIAPVSRWLDAVAPEASTTAGSTAARIAILLALGVLAVAVLRVLWSERSAMPELFDVGCRRLIEAPAAATFWLLLAVAVQSGDTTQVGAILKFAGALVVAVIIAGLALSLALPIVALRYEDRDAAASRFLTSADWSHRVALGVSMIALAVVWSSIWLPVAILSWMSAAESDKSRAAREETARLVDSLTPLPTGATGPAR